MPTPCEHKTVQARILGYAEAIGWTLVPREEAEQRRDFDPDVPPADRDLLGQFRHLHTDLYGNRARPINQIAHIAMNCDKADQSQITRNTLRL
ncbi:MAG: hypothetical protein HWD57_20380 [Candidatus Accumulibacter cognatus]|uniref:Uncharacterized protein n=1 Tax=Candidatus Accumulibacter cognatus TaxID=2954383 RepID=A0A7D5SPG5_9PROT|nr:MAG: hypothetical protein HWD57_20380 [Candidatus Accumulibacter cognatus]